MIDSEGPSSNDATEPEGKERRARVRYPSELRTFFQPGGGRLEDFWWMAKLRDISATGLGLVVPRAFEPGTVLSVELEGDTEDSNRTLQVRVIHAIPQDSGGFLLGCALLDELGEEQLGTLR